MSRLSALTGVSIAAVLTAAALGPAQPLTLAGGPARDPGPRFDHVELASTVSPSALPQLNGFVGGEETITISKQRVRRGWYEIVVRDVSKEHDWQFAGPYVNKRTTVSGTGKWVWKVRLRKGLYRIVCNPHADDMNTYLKVTS